MDLSHIDFYDLHARAKDPGLPPDWEPYLYQALGDRVNDSAAIIEVVGAVAPVVTRGPRKGRRNWNKMDRSTRRTFYFGIAEHRKFIEGWEVSTGKCSRCFGHGQAMVGAGVDGVRYAQCSKCGGDGAYKPLTP